MFFRSSKKMAVVFAAAIAVTAPATSAHAQTTSERNFIATGDSICKKSNERLADEALEFERHKLISRKTASSVTQRVAKPADVAEFVAKFAVKELQGQIDQLSALKPAKSQEEAFAAAMKEANKGLADMKAKPNEAAFRNPMKKAGKLLSALGFRACGQTEPSSKSV
jgi:hypothetical protein